MSNSKQMTHQDHSSHTITGGVITNRLRNATTHASQAGIGDTAPTAASKDVNNIPELAACTSLDLADDADDAKLQARVAALPPWHKQITLRGIVVGFLMSGIFIIITLKLALGSAGIVPSLSIPGGLLSFVSLKLWTVMGKRLGLSRFAVFGPFGMQVSRTGGMGVGLG